MLAGLLLAAAMAVTPIQEDACQDTTKAVELALPLIKQHEGLAKCVDKACTRVRAYPDPGVGSKLPTIGWGTTSLAPGLPRGLRLTMSAVIPIEEADELLRGTVSSVANQVCRAVYPAKPTRHELAALIDFAYNLGVGTLIKSRLLVKLRNGDIEGAAHCFMNYVYAGHPKHVFIGLVRRREAEMHVFLTED